MKVALIFAALVCSCTAQLGLNPCASSDPQVLPACLDYIRAVVSDTDRFFFGSSYEERCAGADPTSIECFNPFGTRDNSIGSILWGAENIDDVLSGLDRVLNMEFYSEEFMYEGCGTKVTQPETTTVIDMSLQDVTPATLRNQPEMEWEFQVGDMFTLICVDVLNFPHYVALNIPGNDLANGDVYYGYSGPLNFRYVPNPYTWILYKQSSGGLALSEEWQTALVTENFVYRLDEFQADLALAGPVAMNIMNVVSDVYAVSTLMTRLPPGLVFNCATFVERAVEAQDEPFLPDDLDFTAFLNVTLTSDAGSFDYCCRENPIHAKNTTLDGIAGAFVNASDARTGSGLHFNVTPNMLGSNASIYTDALFTVIAVDPDVPDQFSFAGNAEMPLIHYFAYNVMAEVGSLLSAKLMGGDVVVEWSGPAPPDADPHHYYFMLLMQAGMLTQEELAMDQYLGTDCPEAVATRCLFDVARFTQDKDLTLLGMSWFRAKNDDYVNFLYGIPEEQACGARWPCDQPPASTTATTTERPEPPVASADTVVLSFVTVFVAAMLSISLY